MQALTHHHLTFAGVWKAKPKAKSEREVGLLPLPLLQQLQATTTATTLAAGGVGGNGGDILNTTNLHTSTGKGAESGLGTGARGLGAVTTGSPELDVKSGETKILALGRHVLSGKHGSVRRGLITVSLDLHTTGNADESLTTGEIRDVDEGVVEGGVDVSDAEDVFTLADNRSPLHLFLQSSKQTEEKTMSNRVQGSGRPDAPGAYGRHREGLIALSECT